MTAYFVSRHPGAVAWAQRKSIVARPVEHLDINVIQRGDMVVGTLPIQLAAAVSSKGARYLHLEIDLPQEARGRNLTADEMEQFGARLQEYRVEKIGQ